MVDPSQCFIGTVKSFNAEKGWGHIDCVETRAIFNKDMFLLRSQLNGASVTQGDQVMFNVREGRQGPEAANVQLLVQTPSGLVAVPPPQTVQALVEVPNSMQEAIDTSGLRSSRWGEGAPPGEEVVRTNIQTPIGYDWQVYRGVLKAFHEDKGWGHISCEATRAIYERDIFVMRSALRGTRIVPGDEVRFGVKQGQKGPEAVDVWPLSFVQAQASTCNINDAGHEFVGFLKMYDGAKGWGFIQCEDSRQLYGKDIFVHKREFPFGVVLNNEDWVQFAVEMGKDGRPEARRVSLVQGQMLAPPAPNAISNYGGGLNGGGMWPGALAAGGAGQHALPVHMPPSLGRVVPPPPPPGGWTKPSASAGAAIGRVALGDLGPGFAAVVVPPPSASGLHRSPRVVPPPPPPAMPGSVSFPAASVATAGSVGSDRYSPY